MGGNYSLQKCKAGRDIHQKTSVIFFLLLDTNEVFQMVMCPSQPQNFTKCMEVFGCDINKYEKDKGVWICWQGIFCASGKQAQPQHRGRGFTVGVIVIEGDEQAERRAGRVETRESQREGMGVEWALHHRFFSLQHFSRKKKKICIATAPISQGHFFLWVHS